MTFIEALYGSQYSEIAQNGKDGSKGRLNGNIFLSAFLFLCLILVFLFLTHFSKVFMQSTTNMIVSGFGGMSGKAIGKILAIPIFAIIYLLVTKTIGTEENFKAAVTRFLKYPEETRRKANAKILMPFFIALGLLLVLVFLG
jgi:hypothetical protein